MLPETFDAIIVGGSLAGLMHAVVLKSLGRKVIVLESRKDHELHAEAAGLGMGPNAQKLAREYLGIDESFAIRAPGSQIISPDGEIVAELPPGFSVIMCTWGLVYERLKTNFLSLSKLSPASVYETGVRVNRFEYDGQDALVKVICTRKNETMDRVIEAPLVIGADGYRSSVRHQLQPDLKSNYAGYVAWRGSVPETQTPDALKGILEGKMIFTLLPGHYVLGILTPGASGSTVPGKRLFDWTWYCISDADSEKFSEMMTDVTGHRHNKTVPRGLTRDEVWNQQLLEHKLPSAWDEVFRKTEEPFVTAISSFEGSSTTFCDGKVMLVGEAYTHFRPNSGLSCDLAAFQALTLRDVLKGEKDMEEYNRAVSEYAHEFSFRSKATGQWGLTGKWPEGYVPLFAKNKASSNVK